MTTIAYRDGVLASDTRETAGDTVVGASARKIAKLKDGSLFGGAGVAEGCELLLRSLQKNTATPVYEGTEALHVKTDGSLWVYEGRAWLKQQKCKYYALGSGHAVALAAMDAGADAITAVKIGIKRDTHSGGRVRSLKLKRQK